jgi:hypothetical protein
MLAFLAAIAALIQQILPLVPAVVGLGETIKQLWALGSSVASSGADPTHDDWAQLVSIQTAVLKQIQPQLTPGDGTS